MAIKHNPKCQFGHARYSYNNFVFMYSYLHFKDSLRATQAKGGEWELGVGLRKISENNNNRCNKKLNEIFHKQSKV